MQGVAERTFAAAKGRVCRPFSTQKLLNSKYQIKERQNMNRKFAVTGMMCAACVSHVEKAVKKLNGVTDVTVSLMTS